jgi:hypothetical protein
MPGAERSRLIRSRKQRSAPGMCGRAVSSALPAGRKLASALPKACPMREDGRGFATSIVFATTSMICGTRPGGASAASRMLSEMVSHAVLSRSTPLQKRSRFDELACAGKTGRLKHVAVSVVHLQSLLTSETSSSILARVHAFAIERPDIPEELVPSVLHPSSSSPRLSLVVLPFANVGGDHEPLPWRRESRANPSLKPKFPASWENTGNFIDSGLGDASTVAKNAIRSVPYGPIPCAS